MRLALAALVFVMAPQDKTALKWKFSKDQALRWDMSQKNVIESDAITSDQDFKFVLKQTVKDVSDKGEATIDTTFEVVKFTLSGFGDSTYDSEKDKKAPDDPIGQALASLLGQTFTMKMDAAGTVTSVKGFDKISDKMVEPLDEGAQMAKNWIRAMYNDDVQKAMMQQAFVQLPAEPVAAGAKWSNDFSTNLPMAGSLDFAVASTLKSVGKEGAQIESIIKVTAGKGGGGMLEVGESKGTRTCVFDPERGLLTENAMDVQVTLKLGDSEIPLKLVTRMKPLPANVASKDEKK